MNRVASFAGGGIAALVLAACAPSPRALGAPSAPATAPTTARAPAPAAVAPTPAPAKPAVPAAPAIVSPPDALYVCVVDRNGQRTQTAIEFPYPKVLDLCRRHPEMSPCQFERNACRSKGGRVFAANGQEITLATEAEYDRKVMRWTFQ